MRRRWVLVGALSAACGAPTPKRVAPFVDATREASVMPGPARARGESVLAKNATCEECHTKEAQEWRVSLHRRAELEPAYQRSFAIEPLPFCRSCHAPEADPMLPTPAALAEVGVACVSCHLDQNGAVLAAPRPDPKNAPHALARDARFASASACAGCHEFAFPGALGRGNGALMQSTASEHAASPFADTSCAECHMPLVDGKRSHAFESTRAPERLRAALRVLASRHSETGVTLQLETVAVGHAFPTGDLFRRLEVSAEAVGPDESSLAIELLWLKRHFEVAPSGQGRVLKGDDRLFSAPRRIELDVGEPARGRPIAWRVAYQRVAHPNGVDDRFAELEDDVTLASGHLPPLPTSVERDALASPELNGVHAPHFTKAETP
jgi:hypothetical protein